LFGGQVLPRENYFDSAIDAPGEFGRFQQCLRFVAVPELGGFLNGVGTVRVLAVFVDSHTAVS